MKPKAIIFDIDMVLADCTHRLHHIKGGKKDYEAFYNACVRDKSIKAGEALLRALLRDDQNIIFITGRPIYIKTETQVWLANIFGGVIWEQQMFTRDDGDHRPDYVYKAEKLDEVMRDYDILFAIDDSPAVIEMYQSKGIFTLQAPRITKEV